MGKLMGDNSHSMVVCNIFPYYYFVCFNKKNCLILFYVPNEAFVFHLVCLLNNFSYVCATGRCFEISDVNLRRADNFQ